MQNLSTAFRPVRAASGVRTVSGTNPESDDWVKTSVSLKRERRRQLKRWAADHDMSIQSVIDEALEAYLD